MLSSQTNWFVCGGGLCAKTNGLVRSLDPFPSAVTWKLCSCCAENKVIQRQELGFCSFVPLWEPACTMSFGTLILGCNSVTANTLHLAAGGQEGEWTESQSLAAGFWSGPSLGLLLLRPRPVVGWLREVRKFVKTDEMEGKRLWGHSGLGSYW